MTTKWSTRSQKFFKENQGQPTGEADEIELKSPAAAPTEIAASEIG